MKPSKAYYCLIQYCPDLSRLEAANVGVVLFCPERQFLRGRTSQDNTRIRRFFGSEGLDWSRINSFKQGIEERLEIEATGLRSLADLERFIATRGNEFQITPPRPMQVIDPAAELDQLFDELVGAASRTERRKSFKRHLEKKFKTAGVERKLMRDIPIPVPVFSREVRIPFGYRNGRLNLLQPVRFEGADTFQPQQTACRYAVEGQSLYQSQHPQFGELQLTVIGKFRPHDDASRNQVEHILKEYHVRLFSLPELPQLIEEIRTTGKDVEPVANSAGFLIDDR